METLFEFLSQDGRIKTLCLSQDGNVQLGQGNIESLDSPPASPQSSKDALTFSDNRRQAWISSPELVEQQLAIEFSGALNKTEEAYFRALAQQLLMARNQLRELTRQPQLLSEIYAIAKHGDQLLFIKGEKGYSGVYGEDGEEPTYIYMRLRALRQYFPDRLIPVHRSYLINPAKVSGVIKTGSNFAIMIGEHQVPLSRSYSGRIKQQYPQWFIEQAA